MYKTMGTIALFGLSAGFASAQSVPPGYYIEGDVVYEYYFDGDGNSMSVFALDTTIGISPGAVGSVPIGAEVYLGYRYMDQGASYDIFTYGGILYYEGNFGRISLGNPRSTINDYVDTVSLGSYFDDSFYGIYYAGGYTNLFVNSEGAANYGVRYDGTFGDFSVGASYHVFTEYSDETAFTIAARYNIGNYALALGYEDFGGSGLVFASASADFGRFGATVGLTTDSDASGLISSLELSYDVMQNLELGFTYVDIDGNYSVSMLSAEYGFYENAYVGARYYDNFISDEAAYALYAGYTLDF